MIEKFIDLVKSQIKYLQDEADRYPPDHAHFSERRQASFSDLAARHQELLSWLVAQKDKADRLASLDATRLGRRLGDLSRVPPDLLKELNATPQKDSVESQIVTTIAEAFDGVASIDEVLVGLYDKYNVVITRKYVSNKLAKLASDGILFKGKRGFYGTTEDAIAKASSDEDSASE